MALEGAPTRCPGHESVTGTYGRASWSRRFAIVLVCPLRSCGLPVFLGGLCEAMHLSRPVLCRCVFGQRNMFSRNRAHGSCSTGFTPWLDSCLFRIRRRGIRRGGSTSLCRHRCLRPETTCQGRTKYGISGYMITGNRDAGGGSVGLEPVSAI